MTERRLKLLREASQAQGVETKPVELYQRICKAISRDPIDIPLLVFYDSSVADDEREMSEDSSEQVWEQNSQVEEREEEEAKSDTRAANDEYESGGTHQSGRAHLKVPSATTAPLPSHHIHRVIGKAGPDKEKEGDSGNLPHNQTSGDVNSNKPRGLSEFMRAAYTGCGENSELFPRTIPPPTGEKENTSIATHPTFLQALRKVQNSHQQVVLHREDMKEFAHYLDKTILGDEITTIAIMP